MNQDSIRALAMAFFDAIEQRDIGAIAALYAPELKFWFNVTGREADRGASLDAIIEGYPRHRRRSYNDRIIHTFDGGFVAQYTLNIVQHSGECSVLWASLVALCSDGKIVRIDEYLDSGKFPSKSVATHSAAPQ